jgi:drug/metabolite transporter (DMT)-like permease
MAAFAANSLLNRIALANNAIDAISFGSIRLVAGALVLSFLCTIFRGRLKLGGHRRIGEVLALLLYIYAFSFAYKAIDAGFGALILFGAVQLTMFTGSLSSSERPQPRQWLGSSLAFAGLVWLLWPSGSQNASVLHGLLMGGAGISWGLYSIWGKSNHDALKATASNFVLAAPVGVLFGWISASLRQDVALSWEGIILALVSGGVTSGLGYALWYSVLPCLKSSTAAVIQLTVPPLAIAGGIVFLSETLATKFALASLLVMFGVVISLTPSSLRRASEANPPKAGTERTKNTRQAGSP